MGKIFGMNYLPSNKIFHPWECIGQAFMKMFYGAADHVPPGFPPRFCDIGIETSSPTESENSAVCALPVYRDEGKVLRVGIPHMAHIKL
jgi:hypothetical protein